MPKLYEIPFLYDLAFRRTGIGPHVDGLIECHKRFRHNHPLRSVLELAAGPSRHALEFVSRNYNAAVVDNCTEMCRYAAALAKENELTLNVFLANMRDYTIPNKYDLAMILLNSIGHLHTASDLRSHLFATWRHLNEDGLYVIEAHFPNWVDRTSLKRSSWLVEMKDLRLRVDFGTPDDDFDLDMLIRKVELHILGDLRGEEIDYQDYLILRSWSASALESVIVESEVFEIVAKLGALNPDIPFDPQESMRLVYVLRRLE
ncbi:MAG: class I SAM-dependent methyltransferase [Cyanobacteria bacterium SZAS-4]|nr:class I SAM-dependent methyltransferase [Cyanobacteria bacterium SZAS-4]